MILMWHHPKYYVELKKIRLEHERKLASEQASEQAMQETVPHNDIEEANRRAGGPTRNKQPKVTSGSRANKR